MTHKWELRIGHRSFGWYKDLAALLLAYKAMEGSLKIPKAVAKSIHGKIVPLPKFFVKETRDARR